MPDLPLFFLTNLIRSEFTLSVYREIAQNLILIFSHEKIENLSGLEVECIYEWEIGSILIFDRSHLHAQLLNGRAKTAAIYPKKLVDEIVTGLIEQNKCDKIAHQFEAKIGFCA